MTTRTFRRMLAAVALLLLGGTAAVLAGQSPPAFPDTGGHPAVRALSLDERGALDDLVRPALVRLGAAQPGGVQTDGPRPDAAYLVWGPVDDGRDLDSDTPTGAEPFAAAAAAVGGLAGWTPIDPGPLAPRLGAATVVTVDGEALLIGGAAGPVTSTLLVDGAAYDPATDTWRPLPDLPAGRAHADAVTVDGFVVVAGGSTDSASSTPSVLVGDGTRPWRTIRVGHRIDDVAAVPGGVVVAGFADSNATVHASEIAVPGGTVTRLPDLGPVAEPSPGATEGTGVTGGVLATSLALTHDDGRTVVAVGDSEGRLATYLFDGLRWAEIARNEHLRSFVTFNRFSDGPRGVLMLDGDRVVTVTGTGVAVTSPGGSEQAALLPRPCIDAAVAAGPDEALVWQGADCTWGTSVHVIDVDRLLGSHDEPG